METYKKHELVNKELKAINGGVGGQIFEVVVPFDAYNRITENVPLERLSKIVFVPGPDPGDG